MQKEVDGGWTMWSAEGVDGNLGCKMACISSTGATGLYV